MTLETLGNFSFETWYFLFIVPLCALYYWIFFHYPKKVFKFKKEVKK